MGLSYREKRIWINLGTQLFVYAVYFYELWRGNVTLVSVVVVIVAMIVMQIVLQIVLVETDRPYPKDERDIAIERTAYRTAYFTLVGALFVCLVLLIAPALVPELSHSFRPRPFQVINLVLFILLLAEVGKLLSQLVLYRKTA